MTATAQPRSQPAGVGGRRGEPLQGRTAVEGSGAGLPTFFSSGLIAGPPNCHVQSGDPDVVVPGRHSDCIMDSRGGQRAEGPAAHPPRRLSFGEERGASPWPPPGSGLDFDRARTRDDRLAVGARSSRSRFFYTTAWRSVDGGRFGDQRDRVDGEQSLPAPRSSPARPSRPGINGEVTSRDSEAREAERLQPADLREQARRPLRIELGRCEGRNVVRPPRPRSRQTCGHKQQHHARSHAKPLAATHRPARERLLPDRRTRVEVRSNGRSGRLPIVGEVGSTSTITPCGRGPTAASTARRPIVTLRPCKAAHGDTGSNRSAPGEPPAPDRSAGYIPGALHLSGVELPGKLAGLAARRSRVQILPPLLGRGA